MSSVPNYPAAYLDSLPGYNCNSGVDSLLDLAREILANDSHYFLGVGFPVGGDILIPALTTFMGNIALEPLTYIVSLTGYCNQPEGFKIRVYDKGAKADIIDRQFTLSSMIASRMEMDFPGVTPMDNPFGPHYFSSPFIILHPGSLQVEITNLSPNPANIQVMFGCAVPVTDRSINIKDIKG